MKETFGDGLFAAAIRFAGFKTGTVRSMAVGMGGLQEMVVDFLPFAVNRSGESDKCDYRN